MNIKYGNLSINIELKNGIYHFDFQSGIGKTYFYEKLKSYKIFSGRQDIRTISYDDIKDLRNYSNMIYDLNSKHYSIIMFDRADLYMNRELADILYGLNSIVLIDIKDFQRAPNLAADMCFIEFTQEGINIYN